MKNALLVYDDGYQTRDFGHGGDLCRAILISLESDVVGKVSQIATGVDTNVLELAAALEEVVEEEVRLEHGPFWAGDVLKRYSGISKAEQILSWQPEVSLADGPCWKWDWFSRETPPRP